ncbi:MAG: hypothetical protein KME57_25565 [Scytonema hyalinum WJT4-NPBG1]|nr:hypothetical protein [Scytonema hyalinum WJT4-NPBG1]
MSRNLNSSKDKKLKLSRLGQERCKEIRDNMKSSKAKYSQGDIGKECKPECDRQTVSKFTKGLPVDPDLFKGLCQRYQGLANGYNVEWPEEKDLVEPEEEDSSLANTTTNLLSVPEFFFLFTEPKLYKKTKKFSKNQVEEIVKQLKENYEDEDNKIEICVGLDLTPGTNWQKAKLACIKKTKAIVLFINPDGTGPWEDQQTFLKEYYDIRNQEDTDRFIFVYLEGASPESVRGRNNFPHFLTPYLEFPVDLNEDDGNLDKLWFALTGKKPNLKPSNMVSTIFGYKSKESSSLIWIPVYSIEKPVYSIEKKDTENPPQVKGLKAAATENLHQEDAKLPCFEDTGIQTNIIKLFEEHKLRTPSWKKDIEFSFNEKKADVNIVIGLSSSVLDNESISKNNPTKYFDLKTVTKDGYNCFVIEIGKFDDDDKLFPRDQWYAVRDDKENDPFEYALFAKLRHNKENIIVCGGITKEATEMLGEYLYKYIDVIYDRLRREKGRLLKPNDPFAVVIEFPRNSHCVNMCNIKYVCIKRESINDNM